MSQDEFIERVMEIADSNDYPEYKESDLIDLVAQYREENEI